MSDEREIVLDLLREFLGKEKAHYDMKCQVTFDCPVCSYDIKGLDHGDGKGNLEINYCRHVYKCWSCGDTNGTHGPLGKLFERYATKKAKRTYDLVKPQDEKVEKKKVFLRLPKGYTQFKDSNPRFIPHGEALRYLHSRGITNEMIEKYKIGYSTTDEFAFRIIIPSYDVEGYLNYFIARAWVPKKMKYKNPTVPKDEIIFNENNIDFTKDIYLTEGVFDMLFLDNCIPLLGKHVSNLLFERLYNEAKGNIHICLDGDAYEDAVKIFHTLNGGELYGRIKIVKLPKDKDVCDLRGDIKEYYIDLMR